MAKAKRKIYGVAKKVFNLQNQYGGVPSDVLASSRAVFANSATQRDRDVIFNYLGVRDSKAQAMTRGLRDLQSPMQKLGDYAALTSTAAQGGYSGAAAAGSIVSRGARDVEALTKNKAVQDAVIGVAAKYFGSAVKGVNLLYGARATAQTVGAGVAYAAAGAAYVKGAVGFGESMAGMNGGEGLRLLQSQAAINTLEGVRVHPYTRKIDELRLQQQTRDLGFASWGALAGKPFGLGGKTSGQMAQDIGKLETEQALLGNGFFNDAQGFRKSARSRVYEDKYGAFGGRLMSGFDSMRNMLGVPNAAIEGEITGQASKNIARAAELRALMYQRAAEGDVDAAKGLQRQVNKELDVPAKWREPQVYFVNADNARAADRVFPATQSMKRLRSYE